MIETALNSFCVVIKVGPNYFDNVDAHGHIYSSINEACISLFLLTLYTVKKDIFLARSMLTPKTRYRHIAI